MLLPFSENVPGWNLNSNGVDGRKSSVEGAENPPRDDSCDDKGMLTAGAGFLDITNVEFILTDPDLSLAVSSTSNAVTVPTPTSLAVGVPESVRVLLSRESQLGALDRL